MEQFPDAQWVFPFTIDQESNVTSRLRFNKVLLIESAGTSGSTITDPSLSFHDLHSGARLKELGSLTGQFEMTDLPQMHGNNVTIALAREGELADLYHAKLSDTDSLIQITTTPLIDEAAGLSF